MKKMLPFLLGIWLLAAAVSPAAAAESSAALPETGDVVEGFEVMEIRDFPLMGAQAIHLEHQKTGAKMVYIANEDTNRVFMLAFNTRPIDNTGLPHVFEHATINGSDKYPSTTLWFSATYQTYNTFMNAFTTDAMTAYPVASLSEAQLLKLADLYTDDCFHPLLMKDESLFRREAWRYRLEDMEGELTMEGTVYSEMLGALDLERQAMLNANRAAFPGSSLGYEYGGDPDFIPDMTWEALKNYHDTYYHPSNCTAYLYGQFEDYTAFLALLNAEFSRFEKQEFSEDTSAYTPITEPVVESYGFPMEAGSSTDNASEIWYYVVCPGMRDNPEEEEIMDQLCNMLGAAASPLMQNLDKVLPYGSFSVGREMAAPDDAVGFNASNVNPEDAELFVETVNSSLREIAENGFSQDLVDAEMASLFLSTALVGESAQAGINIVESISYLNALTGNPFRYLESVEALEKIDEWNQQGLLAGAITDWLLDKETTALVTTYPDPGKQEEKQEALKAKLAEIKAGMSEEELQAIIDFTNAPADDTDNTEMLASLKAVTVQSLPEEIREYAVTEEDGEDGVRRIDVEANVDGIGQVALTFDASGLPQELLHYFSLYTNLLGDMDTSAHSWEELQVLISRYLYSADIRLAIPKVEKKFIPMMRAAWIAADADLEAGYNLVSELLFDTDFSDTARLSDRISSMKSAMRTSFNSTPYNVSIYRAMGVSDPAARYWAYCNGVEYYAFLEQTEALLASEPETVLAGLQAVQEYFRSHVQGFTAGFCGNPESIAVNRPLADGFLASLGTEPFEAQEYDLPVPAAHEAMIVDSNIQFNLLYADYDSLGLADKDAEVQAVSSVISDLFLIPLLRDQYGVYTPMAGAMTDNGIYLLSYRDPNVKETFQVYSDLPQMMSEMELDQDTLDGYLMSTYVNYAQGAGELTGAYEALLNQLQKEPQDKRLMSMRQLKAMTPESVKAYAEVYQAMVENGVWMTDGGAGAVNANADLYEQILNPFGSVDTSQTELTDAPEGSEHYDAIRFAFENGLMLTAAEDAFGADEPACLGELLGGLTAAIGAGSNDPEEALAFWSQYGLVGADADLSGSLNKAAVGQFMKGFGALIGTELPDLLPELESTQDLTRADLAELLYRLLSE